MSDPFGTNKFGQSTFGGTFGRSRFGGSSFGVSGQDDLTPAQRELIPYIQRVKQREEEEQKKINPVSMVFDLLSRGQYVSANVADEFITALKDDDPFTKDLRDVAQGLWEGITGKRKGSFSDVLEKHTDLEEISLNLRQDKLDEEGNVIAPAKERFLGDLDLADIFGFVGDVVLDPINLFSMGTTTAARAAAKSFADDAVRVAAKQMGLNLTPAAGDDILKFVTRGFDLDRFRKLEPEKAVQYAQRHLQGDIAEGLNRTWKQAFERAKVMPAEELRKEMAEQVAKVTAREQEIGQGVIEKMFQRNIQGKLPTEDYMAQKLAIESRPSVLADLEERLFKSYTGAGEAARLKVLGKELGVHQDVAGRNINKFLSGLMTDPNTQELTRLGKIGDTLSHAWWSVMNKGAVGEIRKALGFRNPYEKLVRQKELQDGSAFFQRAFREEVERVDDALAGFSDDEMLSFIKATDYAEKINTPAYMKKAGAPYTVFDVLDDTDAMQKAGVSNVDPARIGELAQNVRGVTNQWQIDYNQLDPYVKVMDSLENYIPSIQQARAKQTGRFSQVSAATPGFAKERALSRSRSAKIDKSRLKWALKDTDITDVELDRLVQGGMGGPGYDLRDLLYTRAQAQAGARKRANLMESMREFGVDLRGLRGDIKTSIEKGTKAFEEAGLSTVNQKGFENLVFDKTVADVFGTVAKTMSDTYLPTIRRKMKQYMGWWKGMVTMTPGFHARNFVSNNATGYIRHGAKWFNPASDKDSIAVVLKALHGDKLEQSTVLKELGLTQGWLSRALNKEVVPGYTLNQAAQDLKNSGLIGDASMGFSARGAKELAQKAPAWKQAVGIWDTDAFWGTQLSRGVGNIVENQAKVKSYLLNMDEIYGTLGKRPAFLDEAKDFAVMDAKKWFLDYDDLTDFERNFMKDVIPFYTWIRKNLANQMSSILMYPQMYAMYPKMMDFAQMEDPNFDPSLVPEWQAEQSMFPIAKRDGQYMMFRPDLPFQDLNLIPMMFREGRILPQVDFSEIKNDLVNAANPMIKQAMSLMTEKGYDFFRRKELEETAPAPYAVQLLVREPQTLAWLDNALQWAGGESLGLKMKVENGKLNMDARLMQLIDTFVPVLRQVNQSIYAGTAFIPTLEQAIESATGIEDDYDKLEQMLQVIAYGTGLKTYLQDQPFREEQRGISRYYSARDLREQERRLTPAEERAAERRRDRTSETIRRLTR